MAKVDELYKVLDQEKDKYHKICDSIKSIELDIATNLCPYKIGDRIRFLREYEKGTKIFEGIIECIHPEYYNPADNFMPIVGKYPTWAISGKKINADGVKGKHSFDVGPAYYRQDQDGVFIKKTLSEFLD